MFNITDAVAALRDADTIISSSILTEDEKGRFLADLIGGVPPSFNRPYLTVLSTALDRLYDSYRPAEAGPTEGLQDATPVAPRDGEATEATPARTAEGEQEQAQDIGRVPDGGHVRPASTEAAPEAQKPKAGKARK